MHVPVEKNAHVVMCSHMCMHLSDVLYETILVRLSLSCTVINK